MLTKQSAYDAMAALMDPTTDNKDDITAIKNWVSKMDIDPRFGKYIHSEIKNRLETIYNKNQDIEDRLSEDFDPRQLTSPTIIGRTQELRTDNPKAFNDIISWLAEFQQAEQKRKMNGVEFNFTGYDIKKNGNLTANDPATAAYLDSIKGKFKDSATIADQAIADFYNERSLTTSAINAAFKAFETVASEVPTMSKDQINEKLKKIDTYLQFLSKNANYTGNHLDAAALQTFDMNSFLSKIADSKILTDKITETYPFIREYLLR